VKNWFSTAQVSVMVTLYEIVDWIFICL